MNVKEKLMKTETLSIKEQVEYIKNIQFPCIIYRPKTDEYIQWDGDIIVFNNGINALDFINMFSMLFPCGEDYGLKLFNEDNDMEGFIPYNDIEGQLEEERNNLLHNIVYGMERK